MAGFNIATSAMEVYFGAKAGNQLLNRAGYQFYKIPYSSSTLNSSINPTGFGIQRIAPDSVPNVGNLRKLKDSRLKDLGIDAEEFKKSIVGNGGSRFNMSIGDNGDVFLIPVQKGAAPPIPTGATLDELPSLYPRGGGR